MKLVTVATESKGYFKWLVESCNRHKYDLKVLGYGQNWQGFAWRFKLVMDYLHDLPPDEVVCFIDAYDVIMLCDSEILEAKFKKIHEDTQCKIVIAKEIHNTILIQMLSFWTFGSCKSQYINAGTYIGYTKDIIDVLSSAMSINNNSAADDQQILNDVCHTFPHNVIIDENNQLFLTFVTQYSDVPLDKIKYELQKHRPCIFHAPNNGYMVNLLKYLGYSVSLEDEQMLLQDTRQGYYNRIIYFGKLPQNILALFFIILVCIWVIWKIRKRAKNIKYTKVK
jgi:hypothetical protein